MDHFSGGGSVLLFPDGRLKAVVVGVGSYLGLAKRDIAVPWYWIEVGRDQDGGLLLRLDLNREQIEAVPPW